MSEQQRPTADMVERAGTDLTRSLAEIVDLSAEDVFGTPVQVGERTIITAAVVTRGGGFGFGGGGGEHEAPEPDAELGMGVGAGGGGGGEGRPVAVIEITPDGTTVRPVIDFTKVGLSLLTGLFGLWRAARRGRPSGR